MRLAPARDRSAPLSEEWHTDKCVCSTDVLHDLDLLAARVNACLCGKLEITVVGTTATAMMITPAIKRNSLGLSQELSYLWRSGSALNIGDSAYLFGSLCDEVSILYCNAEAVGHEACVRADILVEDLLSVGEVSLLS